MRSSNTWSCDWPLSLSMFSEFTELAASTSFLLPSVHHMDDKPYFIHWWVGHSGFHFLAYEYSLKYCIWVFCMDMYSDLWGIYIEVELLGHMVSLMFNFLMNQQFSIAVVPFYIPTSDKWGFRFPHILANTYFLFYYRHSGGMKWCFIVVLIYISLMT